MHCVMQILLVAKVIWKQYKLSGCKKVLSCIDSLMKEVHAAGTDPTQDKRLRIVVFGKPDDKRSTQLVVLLFPWNCWPEIASP